MDLLEHGQLDWQPTLGPAAFFEKGKRTLNLITVSATLLGDVCKWAGGQDRKSPDKYSHHFKWKTSAGFAQGPLRAWDPLAVHSFHGLSVDYWRPPIIWDGEDKRTPPPPLGSRVYASVANSSWFSHILRVLEASHWLPLALDYISRHVCTIVLWTWE